MGRVYVATIEGIAVTVQQDLFEVVAPSDMSVIVLEVGISQETNEADANEEQLRIVLQSGYTTTGSGGSGITAAPNASGDAAETMVIARNNTTKATVGTILTHHAESWNVRAPFLWLPTDKCKIELKASRRFVVRLNTTPDASITFNAVVKLEEIG